MNPHQHLHPRRRERLLNLARMNEPSSEDGMDEIIPAPERVIESESDEMPGRDSDEM